MSHSCGTTTTKDIVLSYYAAYMAGDLETVERLVHPNCIIDEPSFLPYGQVPVVGFKAMHRLIAETFTKVFREDFSLDDTRIFENGSSVIAQSIWRMTPKFGGAAINCHYHELFEVDNGQIILMRPFYHAVAEMSAAFDAARAAGVDLDLTAVPGV